jgi:serine/threonine-protein kinase
MRWAARPIVAFGLAVTAMAPVGRAGAQSPSSEAAATALFDEGRRLMDQHRWADACPKLAQSQQIAPSGGTLINLAECYEHTGQTASAWVAWKGAAARANAAGKREAERSALARAAALEPSLARLTIVVEGPSDVEGLVVRRDGVVVGHAEFGMGIPVDPGTHVIEASAPKKKALSAKVDVSASQPSARVNVRLEDELLVSAQEPATPVPPGATVAPPVEQPSPASAPHPSGTQRALALVAGGAGLVGIGTGAVFGLIAQSKNDEALKPANCRTSMYCTPAGLQLTSDAKDAANVSTIAFGVGAAAIAVGAVLWLTSPSTTGVGIRATPVVAGTYQGVAIDGAW